MILQIKNRKRPVPLRKNLKTQKTINRKKQKNMKNHQASYLTMIVFP